MPAHGVKETLALRHALLTCQILFRCILHGIERENRSTKHTTSKITLRATERAGSEDSHEV